TGREEGDEVGDEEGAAAVLVGHAGEAPDVPEPHRRSDRGEDEAVLAGPLLAFRRRRALCHRVPSSSQPTRVGGAAQSSPPARAATSARLTCRTRPREGTSEGAVKVGGR